MLGYRVIMPVKFRDRLLSELHSDHPGISKIKINIWHDAICSGPII